MKLNLNRIMPTNPKGEAYIVNVKWLLCPFCESKTRIKIREDTELKKLPLFCPKCRHETLINVKQLNISVVREPDA